MLPRNPLANLTHYSVPHVRLEFGGGVGTFSDREYLLIYTTEGVSEWRMGGELYVLCPGSCLLLPPHIPHLVKPRGRINQYIAHFSPNAPGGPGIWPYVIEIGLFDQPSFKSLFDQLLLEFRMQQQGSQWVITGLLTALLAMYARHSENVERPTGIGESKTWRNISRALILIQSKPESQITVEGLAHHSGLSVSYFCRAFLQETGYSPHEYLNRVRIQKAKELLLDPKLNCTEVARQLGFSSIHVFSKVFRRLERRSPTAYAKNPWAA